MIPVTNSVLYTDALSALAQHRAAVGQRFRGRFIQVFLALKFFQNNIPSISSGSFIGSGPLQSLFDDLYSKASRSADSCVLSIFMGSYLARTGVSGPGQGSQNTWRNNLNIQKGIGCYAPAEDLADHTFLNQSRLECRHLQTAVAGTLANARCSLCSSGAGYRNENHRKWLHIDPGGSGYAATDLQNVENFLPYVAPEGYRLPVFPLITALYHDAYPGLVLGTRQSVTLDDFAADFNFSLDEFSAYFDTSPTHPLNASVMSSPGWSVPAGIALPVQPAVAAQSLPTALPVTPAALQPLLTGTPVPPPNVNSGWDAEQYVAAALTNAGWSAHVVSRQQLGYDIFAERGTSKRYVEVKSSVGPCSPVLTAREWQQANLHRANFVLAILENFNPTSQNTIHWVRDPGTRCIATPQTTISHGISRSSWAAATVLLNAI